MGVPKKIFGPKSEEVTRNWKKKLHNEELHYFHYSPYIVRMIRKGS
jgi:hypothetical protein